MTNRIWKWIERFHNSKRSVGKVGASTVESLDDLPEDARAGSQVYVKEEDEVFFYNDIE